MKRRKKSVPSGQAKVRDMKARPCFCGGGPLIFSSAHAPGELSTCHIRCGDCGKEPMFGVYRDEDGKYPSHVDFFTEDAALDAWNAIVTAGLSNG